MTALLEQTVRRLIARRAGRPLAQVQPATRLLHDLNQDALDVFELILALERRFGVVIPDSAPLHTPADFVACLRARPVPAP